MISLGLESPSLHHSNRLQRPRTGLNAALQSCADMTLGDIVLAAEPCGTACAMHGEGQGGDGIWGHEKKPPKTKMAHTGMLQPKSLQKL